MHFFSEAELAKGVPDLSDVRRSRDATLRRRVSAQRRSDVI